MNRVLRTIRGQPLNPGNLLEGLNTSMNSREIELATEDDSVSES